MDPTVSLTPVLTKTQLDFTGGLDLFHQDHAILENAYGESYNIRNRDGELSCILGPTTLTDAPAGRKQGIFGFDKFIVLFNSGYAYTKDITDPSSTWELVDGFYMDPNVSRFYAQAVPASTTNFLRKLENAVQINGTSHDPHLFLSNTTVNGTAAGLVVQDGINQPFLILPDATAVRLQSYEEWTMTRREYVPIGKQMAYMNGILFVVAPDSRRIYRSVSGRPLDFAVNVDVNGNKGGNADTMSYAVSFVPITCLYALNNGLLLVGTSNGMYPIEFNYETIIFQEPTFKNTHSFMAGIMNHFSLVEMPNDYVFIDRDGIRSYNAISQLNNEGRNSIFSAKISRALNGITQDEDRCAAIMFDNYALFAVKTWFGYMTLVYDVLTESWVSIDDYGVGIIKQFAVTNQADAPQLFAISDTQVFELFSADEITATVSSRSVISGDAQEEVMVKALRAVFIESDTSEQVHASSYIDGQQSAIVIERLTNNVKGIPFPMPFPIKFTGRSSVDNILFNFSQFTDIGWKVGCRISWKSSAKLIQLQIECGPHTSAVSARRQSKVYA